MGLNKEVILSMVDCKQLLKNYLLNDNFEIIDYDVQPFSENVNGYMGEHLLITISFLKDHQETKVRFFGKRFPFDHELHSRYAKSLGAFDNEIFTYEVFFKKFNEHSGFNVDFAPKMYFGKPDLVIFEDLTKKGFLSPDHINALSLDELKIILKALSKYHAASISYQETKSKETGTKYRLIEEYQTRMPEPLFKKDPNFLGYAWLRARLSAYNAMIDMLPPMKDITHQKFKEELALLHEKSFEIMKPKDEFYNTLCHGDMWTKNVMIRYENNQPADCKLIDFQLQRYGPPAHDVLQIIYLTTSTAVRKRHLSKLLLYYYQCLNTELQKRNINIDTILSQENFDASIAYLMPQIKLQTAYFLSVQSANPEFLKKIIKNDEDFKNLEFGDGAPFSQHLFTHDQNYRNLTMEMLMELKDLITHQKIIIEDCYKIVENKFGTTDYELSNYSIEPLNEMLEHFSSYYRLKIEILLNKEPKTLNLFIKSFPDCKMRLKMVTEAKSFTKEAFVYRTLIPLVQKMGIYEIGECVPNCYLLYLNNFLVLDDLKSLNYKVTHSQKPFSFEELEVIVKKLAQYHAANITLEERKSQENGKSFRLDCFTEAIEETYFPSNHNNYCSLIIKKGIETVPFLISLFPELLLDVSYDVLNEKIKKIFEATYKLVKSSTTYRNVICHGDLWKNNIMIKYENGKPIDGKFIDFQVIRYCPPAHDLLNLLYSTTNRKVRTDFMQQLIDIYYSEFVKILNKYGIDEKKIYTYKKFLESCEYLKPQAVCQTVVYYQITVTDEKNLVNEETTFQRFVENREQFISSMCQQDLIYKERIYESLLDLKEMCLKYF